MTGLDTDDLLGLTAALVDVPSVSHHERHLVDLLERELRDVPGLQVERVGDNVVARTALGRPCRLILAGHTDTVPGQGNERARLESDRLWGLGACDMKGALAVFLRLARELREPAIDLTFVFYAREEVAAAHSGLEELFSTRPELVDGDAAILGEPTGGLVEAGCQGTLRLRVTLRGVRAHTARAWMGRNAIHRLGDLLTAVAAYEPREPVVGGLRFREALQAVSVQGGVAGNVVPDEAILVLNVRFAPDRSVAQARAHIESVIAPFVDREDLVELTDFADAAFPGLSHPLLQPLVGRFKLAVNPKLGWTDVARFSSRGIPAVNLGPGDPTLAHTAGEHVDRRQLQAVYDVLAGLVALPGAAAG